MKAYWYCFNSYLLKERYKQKNGLKISQKSIWGKKSKIKTFFNLIQKSSLLKNRKIFNFLLKILGNFC